MSATTAIVGEMTTTATTTITATTTVEKRPMPELPWKHAYRQGFATIGEGRCREPFSMYYELHGTGPKKVALLMGMNSPCQAWDYQTTHFGAQGEYTVLTFDARGVGWTGGSWDWYNSEDWARDVIDLLDHLGWTQDVHAVGHSAGGQALLKTLLLSPERFRSAALLNTTAGGIRPFTGPWVFISNLFVSDKSKQMERLMRINYTENWLNEKPEDGSYNTNFEKLQARMIARNSRTKPQTAGSLVSQAVASLRHWVSASDLHKIKASGIPTLVVSNSWDNYAYLSHSQYLNDMLESWKFVVYEDTGHNVPTSRHKELNQLLSDFWKHADNV
ncbi:alpha beta-hydrolase [Lichtheimia corymbifera JMRC:FSU:9682]|uniref:Alpha beta-hydrolase n=1 Tax=Lichtheimia corymbifera JMRC:FSU:9682 TaxID=1263082 RepID=A0A068RIE0_9FUNG|nr:alpha beta-hydrolase [Lichtheimia corymbifera JMRC:FSU:9682]